MLPCYVHGLGSTPRSLFLPSSALVVLMKYLFFPFQSPQVIPFCLETSMRPRAFLEMNLIAIQGHESFSANSSCC